MLLDHRITFFLNMQANREENTIIFFQDLPEPTLNIGSEGQKSDLQLVVNSPSNAHQEPEYSPDINKALGSDLSAPENRVIYRRIPMSGNKELMALTSPSLHKDDTNKDVPPVKEKKNDLAGNSENKYKVQDLKKPAQSSQSDAKKFCKKMMTLYCNFSSADVRKGLNVLLLILALVNLGLLIALFISQNKKTDAKFRPVTSALSYIGSNLQSHPILDIKPQDADQACPEDYKSLVLGVWPGTVQGCDCPDGLRTGPCRKSPRSPPPDPSCDDYSARNPINMYDWGGSKWCVLRAKPGSQYVKKAGKCGTGFKKCSSGICLREALDCPVTKVKLETGAIVLEKTLGESPVIDLKIAPNNIPCFSGAYFARGSVDPYVLIDEHENGCGKYGLDDKYSFEIDTQKQDKLFNENDFPKKVLNLPRYASVYEKTDSVLSYRRRLSVAEADYCLNLDTEILENSSEAFDKLQSHLKEISIAALVFQSGLVGFVILMLIRVLCDGNSFRSSFTGKTSGVWLCFYASIGLMVEIVMIIMLAFIAHGRAKMRETQGYLSEVAEMGCFLDQQAQSAVSDFHNLIEIETGTPLRYCIPVFLIASFSLICSMYLSWQNREGCNRVPIGPSYPMMAR